VPRLAVAYCYCFRCTILQCVRAFHQSRTISTNNVYAFHVRVPPYGYYYRPVIETVIYRKRRFFVHSYRARFCFFPRHHRRRDVLRTTSDAISQLFSVQHIIVPDNAFKYSLRRDGSRRGV